MAISDGTACPFHLRPYILRQKWRICVGFSVNYLTLLGYQSPSRSIFLVLSEKLWFNTIHRKHTAADKPASDMRHTMETVL